MSKAKFFVVALIVIFALSFGAILVFDRAAGDVPYSVPWSEPKRPRAEVEAALREHVRGANVKASQAIARRSAEFSAFVHSREAGAKPFSKDVISWYGKWRTVKPYLPFTDTAGHKKYVAEKFNQHIFTNDALAAAIRRAIEGSVKDLEGIENELAVALRQEILGRSLAPNEAPIAAKEFRLAIDQMVAASQWEVTKTAGNLVTSEVAAQIGIQIMTRLGVSAGLLSAGAASSVWTLGAGLVIGLLADAAWGWIDDPAANIEREMISALNNLSSNGSAAISQEMIRAISQRGKLWDKSLQEML